MKLTLRTAVTAYLGAGVAMLALDFVWLSITANVLYRPLIGALMADEFRPVPALLFYALYLCGVVIFAIRPALDSGRWIQALLLGGAFGLIGYGVYDLTNEATLKIWSPVLTVADMAWGTVLTAIAASAGFFAARKLGGR